MSITKVFLRYTTSGFDFEYDISTDDTIPPGCDGSAVAELKVIEGVTLKDAADIFFAASIALHQKLREPPPPRDAEGLREWLRSNQRAF